MCTLEGYVNHCNYFEQNYLIKNDNKVNKRPYKRQMT